jgi:hypothetical protein
MEQLDVALWMRVFTYTNLHADMASVAQVCRSLRHVVGELTPHLLLGRLRSKFPLLCSLPQSRKIPRCQRGRWSERSAVRLLRDLGGIRAPGKAMRALTHFQFVAELLPVSIRLDVFWQSVPAGVAPAHQVRRLSPLDGILSFNLQSGEGRAILSPNGHARYVSVLVLEQPQGVSSGDTNMPWVEHIEPLGLGRIGPFGLGLPEAAPPHVLIRLSNREYISPEVVYDGDGNYAISIETLDAGRVDARALMGRVIRFGMYGGEIHRNEAVMALTSWIAAARGYVVTLDMGACVDLIDACGRSDGIND